MANENKGKVGILVGGGPAPGINGVISAVTIKAINYGLEVIGFYNGFKWLVEKDKPPVTKELKREDVSRIYFEGGSILHTSRTSLLDKDENGELVPSKEKINNVIKTLTELDVKYLVTIGGDDTAFSARLVCENADGIKVAHVPKTIDNDIPLPENAPTFGFQTARHAGALLVRNIMEDSRTTGRWYFVEAMGRKAGHLALGIGQAAGATLTIIGEEFKQGQITLDNVCDVLEGAMLKRKAVMQRNDGVAIVAEGLTEHMDERGLEEMLGDAAGYDEFGHLRLSEVPLGTILKKKVQDRFKERGEKIQIVDVKFGYELRCAPPIPFDCEYVRALGYHAVRYLLNEEQNDAPRDGGLVCFKSGKLEVISFDELKDPETGRTKVRLVDIKDDSYAVARAFMIRLEEEDFKNQEMLAVLAKEAKMSVDEFRQKFEYLVC